MAPPPSLGGLEVEDPAAVMRKVDRHLIPWFFSLGVCCYLDRTNLAFAAVQLSRDLRLSCATYGLGAGLFFLGYSFQVPSNMALARLGAPVWLSSIVVAWGVVAAAFAATNGTAMFLALRVALGLAECGTFPGIWAHLSAFYSPRELGTAYTKVTTSTALAQVLGAPLAAGVLSLDGTLGLAGWQWLFLVEGATTMAFGVALRLRLAPSPAAARFLAPAEREWLQRRQDGQPTAGGADRSLGAAAAATAAAARNWRVWYMSALWLSITCSMYGIIFFAPMMIHQMFAAGVESGAGSGGAGSGELAPEGAGGGGGCSGEGGSRGGSGAGVALLSMVPFAAAAAAMLVNARLAEAANERHRHAGLPILLGALFLGATPLALRFLAPAAAFAALVAAAASVWAFHAPFMSWPAIFLKGPEASAGFAIINSLGSLGGFFGPLLLGVLAGAGGGSYDVPLFVLALVLGAGGAGILLFPVPGREEVAVEVVGEEGGEAAGGDDGNGELKAWPGGAERQPMLRRDGCH